MQQTRHARRLYVGGIPQDTQDDELRDFFVDVISRAIGESYQGSSADSVVSVYINLERSFAFVELRTIEITAACMSLDGIQFRGHTLKIRRPNDYNPQLIPPTLGPIPELNLAALGIVSTTVPDGPNKIFIGGLPYHLTEDQVKELLSAFGQLKAFHLVRDSNPREGGGQSLSKGYAFCEYMDPKVLPAACEGLNGLQLGDKTLTVRSANSHQPSQGAAATGAAAFAQQMVQAGLAPDTVMAPAFSKPPTKVVVLKNITTVEELSDDQEYDEIVLDIKEECEKHGRIGSLKIPRPGSAFPQSAVGKVFIKYESEAAAALAATSLQGRRFADRTVETDYYDVAKFDADQLE